MATSIRGRAGTGCVLVLLLAVCAHAQPAQAQVATTPAPSFDSLQALDAYYNRQLDDLERRRITDLAALAAAKRGADADAAYRALFQRVLDHGPLDAAVPAAQRCIANTKTSSDVLALATLVTAAANLDRGKPDAALDALQGFVRRVRTRTGEDPSARDAILGVGEAVLQRLIQRHEYRVAARACEVLGADAEDRTVKSHFEARLRALRLVGAKAPPLHGTDVDGRAFQPAALAGKVLLVHFWATWQPASVAALHELNRLARKYEDRGFEVVGVNLDAHHEDVPDAKAMLPSIRHVLVEQGVMWPNLLSDDAQEDLAQRFGVTTLPANFVIGRDGTVVGFEVHDRALEGLIEQALARPKP